MAQINGQLRPHHITDCFISSQRPFGLLDPIVNGLAGELDSFLLRQLFRSRVAFATVAGAGPGGRASIAVGIGAIAGGARWEVGIDIIIGAVGVLISRVAVNAAFAGLSAVILMGWNSDG